MSKIFDDFSYEIVSDEEMSENVHASTDIRTGLIKIKESVYEGACKGNGRDRMTIAHEIGHYLMLCICGFTLERSFFKADTCRDPEWQSKCFAGELMISKRLVKEMTPQEIVEKCGVSFDAAKYQHDKYQESDAL
ncbi:MAG: ImmA/IrrE family metallo-endopeptidase [Eubacteriales bacterium]|nr:ImmA/IrrE family metallo-endopeptidase [Eubacteriales bacterium]